jgi:hypothetical protein
MQNTQKVVKNAHSSQQGQWALALGGVAREKALMASSASRTRRHNRDLNNIPTSQERKMKGLGQRTAAWIHSFLTRKQELTRWASTLLRLKKCWCGSKQKRDRQIFPWSRHSSNFEVT